MTDSLSNLLLKHQHNWDFFPIKKMEILFRQIDDLAFISSLCLRVKLDTRYGPKNTHLLCKGEMADLLFYLFGSICFAYVKLKTLWLVLSKLNPWNRRSAMHLYFTVESSKFVISVWAVAVDFHYLGYAFKLSDFLFLWIFSWHECNATNNFWVSTKGGTNSTLSVSQVNLILFITS